MNNSKEIIEDPHFQLLAFLITSARGCVDEPLLYGPLRLIDAASRLIDIMKKENLSSEEINSLQESINKNMYLLMYDPDAFVKFLDNLSISLAKIIK